MSKPKTHVVFILDKSGSMSGKETITVSNYNEHVDEVQLRSQEQDIDVSLITFGSTVVEHLWRQPASQVEKSSVESYRKIINGSTALMDAWGYSIDKLLDETENDPEANYLVIVLSDGGENASKNYNYFEIRSRIEELEATGRWTFTLLGCDKSYLEQLCSQTGIKQANVAACNLYDSSEGIKGGKFMRAASVNYFDARGKGESVQNLYTSTAENLGFSASDNSVLNLDNVNIEDQTLITGTADVFNGKVATATFAKRAEYDLKAAEFAAQAVNQNANVKTFAAKAPSPFSK